MAGGARRPAGRLSRSLGAVLSREADDQGISDTQLGALVGISQGQMSAHLRGERALNIEELQAVCNALGLRISDVLGEAENP